jgi:putative hemolysin
VTTELLIIFGLVLLNGFFAMAEIALLTVKRSRLKTAAAGGSVGARMALVLQDDPNRFLATVQIGMTLISVLTGAFSGATLAGRLADYLETYPTFLPYAEPLAFTLVVMSVTYLTLIIGELVPKRLAMNNAEPLAKIVSYPMTGLAMVTAPLVWILKVSTELVLRLMRLAGQSGPSVTEEDIKSMLVEGSESGALHGTERQMMEGVMRLADRSLPSIMTPRLDMVWLNLEKSAAENFHLVRHSGYSRFPVARDNADEIIGIVQAKDLLNAYVDGKEPDIETVMRRPLVVPDGMSVLKLLEQFKQTGQHIAIVLDEYGTAEGLVSVTDILTAIAGDMPEKGQDHYDQPVVRADGSWLLDGLMAIDEVEDLIASKGMQDDGDYHTLAGFVMARLGRIPVTGDLFVWQNFEFEVMDMDGRRVDKMMVRQATP